MTGAVAMCGAGRRIIAISAPWGDIVAPAANANVILTVPASNSGDLRFEITIGTVGENAEYRINSGTYTAFDDGAVVNFSNGDTLNFQDTNAAAHGYTVDVYDDDSGTLLDTFTVVAV